MTEASTTTATLIDASAAARSRASRLRAGRYYAARPDVFADAYMIRISGWGSTGGIDMQAEAGGTESARAYFEVTSAPEQQGDFLRWTHTVGREGHSIVLLFIEETVR